MGNYAPGKRMWCPRGVGVYLQIPAPDFGAMRVIVCTFGSKH